jgi:hypothetical protein
VSAVLFALPLALYVLTATRTVQGGDTGELAVVGAAGGVPHPPGYPLYTLLARVCGALPWGPPAWRVALLSALCAAAAVAVLERALYRVSGSRLASAGAALAFAVAPIQWRLAGVPEVFALHALCAALVLLAAIRLADAPTEEGRLAALALGGALGLGLANHHTIVLLAPLPLWGVLAYGRRAGRRRGAAAAALAAGGALAGVALYAVLPLLARDGAWVWGDPGTPGGLVDHVLRREYGTLQLGLSPAARRPLEHVGAFLASLPRGFFYLYFAAGLVGLAAVWRRRGLAIALVAALLLAGVAFPAWFNLPRTPVAAEVAARFHLLPTLLFAVAVAAGLAAIARRLSPLAARLLVLAPLACAALATYGQADWRGDPTIERFLVAAVREAAPDAIILGQGDLELFGFTYVREGLRQRPDLHFVDVNLLRRRWYHARITRVVPGLALPFDPTVTRLGAVIDAAAARGPVYLTRSLAADARGVALYPEGLLARVLPASAAAPPPAALTEAAERALAALHGLPPRPVDAWSALARSQAAGALAPLVDALARTGDPARAGALRKRLDELAPSD